MDPFPPQDAFRSPAPNRLSKQEHAPGALLVAFPAPASIGSIKQPTGGKKIIADKMSAICPLFQLSASICFRQIVAE